MLESACHKFVLIGCRDSHETTDGVAIGIGSWTESERSEGFLFFRFLFCFRRSLSAYVVLIPPDRKVHAITILISLTCPLTSLVETKLDSALLVLLIKGAFLWSNPKRICREGFFGFAVFKETPNPEKVCVAVVTLWRLDPGKWVWDNMAVARHVV